MPRLSIRLLGPFDVTLDGEPVTGFSTDKVRALLAYLAMNPNRHHRRETLAGLLWPDYPETSARASLRNALGNLRRSIGDHDASPPYLLVTRQTICFESSSDSWLDVAEFSSALEPNEPESDDLERAVAQYRGPFLQGFSTPDSAAFEEWLLFTREQLSRQVGEALSHLVQTHQARGAHDLALPYAWRFVELDPWREEAHRQLMQLLASSGQRTAALNQYEACRQILAGELGVEPEPETTRLYEQIRDGQHRVPGTVRGDTQGVAPTPALPAFLVEPAEPVQPPLFVAREQELDWLGSRLADALAGQGQVAFVMGGPGRGKTAFLAEFARRAMAVDQGLLVASGTCNAYSGVGDPYLPFREVLAMLTGDVEASYAAGAISRDHALRLWTALPLACQALVDHGPHLAPALIPCLSLLDRAAAAAPPGALWLQQLTNRIDCSQTAAEILAETDLFQQVTNLLRNLAREQPLLLILDDLQWADSASAGLLFHLGRRLAGNRILIAGAYRPEEIVSSSPGSDTAYGAPHPLRQVLAELQRQHGAILLDLAGVSEPEGHHFVDSLLDSEPNHLGDRFRSALFAHTQGHPLFTIELLRTMQERGDLVQDQGRAWQEGPALHWDTLPPRVEGIIQARIGRLDRDLRELLSVSSVEGETFTAQVVARVQGLSDRETLRLLSRELEDRHHLVREHSVASEGSRWLARYRFSHALFQQYLYQVLGDGERALLHGEVARILEELHRGQLEEVAAVLAHHYAQAHDRAHALKYFTLAGDVALAAYASREAEEHYRRALDLKPVAAHEAELLSNLGEALARQDRYQEAMATWRHGLERYQALEDGDAVARLYARSAWAAGRAGDEAEHLALCLEGLDHAGEAPDGPGRARLLHETAVAYMAQARRQEIEPFAEKALKMAERLGEVELQAQALATWSTLPRHSVEEGIALAYRAAALAEEHGLLLAAQRAHTYLAFRLNPRLDREEARRHFRRGAELAGQGGLAAEQSSNLANLARDYMRSGQFAEADELLEQARRLLDDLDEVATARATIRDFEMQELFFLGHWSACADMVRTELSPLPERGATRDQAGVAMWLGWATVESLIFQPDEPAGEVEEAEAVLALATEAFDRSFSAPAAIVTRGAWATLCLMHDRLADAQQLLVEANELAGTESYPPWIEGRRLWLMAEVAVALGEWSQALAHFEEACDLQARSSIWWLRARMLLSWAEAHLSRGQSGDRQRAAELLREAQEAFQDMGVPRYAAIARARLQELAG